VPYAEVRVVSRKQRRRQLARAKWERQQQRRGVAERRRRIVSSVGGVVVGIVVVALLGWLVVHIVSDERARTPAQTVPTDTVPSPSTRGTP
jgi:peptidyl-prolyl cis-trans isomerase B (cyclophilin B)